MVSEFDRDLVDDVESVFMDDFGVSALIQRDGVDVGLRVSVQNGITRLVDERYIKAQFEVRAARSTGLRQGEQITILNDSGLPHSAYILKEPIEADAHTILFSAKKVTLS